jgi:hypothetical protein
MVGYKSGAIAYSAESTLTCAAKIVDIAPHYNDLTGTLDLPFWLNNLREFGTAKSSPYQFFCKIWKHSSPLLLNEWRILGAFSRSCFNDLRLLEYQELVRVVTNVARDVGTFGHLTRAECPI